MKTFDEYWKGLKVLQSQPESAAYDAWYAAQRHHRCAPLLSSERETLRQLLELPLPERRAMFDRLQRLSSTSGPLIQAARFLLDA